MPKTSILKRKRKPVLGISAVGSAAEPYSKRERFSPLVKELSPEWLRMPAAEAYSQLKKSRLYELIESEELKSFLLKPNKYARRGVRMISRSSIDAYLDRKAKESGVN
jgi:hypothetical protein